MTTDRVIHESDRKIIGIGLNWGRLLVATQSNTYSYVYDPKTGLLSDGQKVFGEELTNNKILYDGKIISIDELHDRLVDCDAPEDKA